MVSEETIRGVWGGGGSKVTSSHGVAAHAVLRAIDLAASSDDATAAAGAEPGSSATTAAPHKSSSRPLGRQKSTGTGKSETLSDGKDGKAAGTVEAGAATTGLGAKEASATLPSKETIVQGLRSQVAASEEFVGDCVLRLSGTSSDRRDMLAVLRCLSVHRGHHDAIHKHEAALSPGLVGALAEPALAKDAAFAICSLAFRSGARPRGVVPSLFTTQLAPRAVRGLQNLLQHAQDPRARVGAVMALCRLSQLEETVGTELSLGTAETVAPVLVGMVKKQTPASLFEAAVAVSAFAGDPVTRPILLREGLVPALVACLGPHNLPPVIQQALRALQNLVNAEDARENLLASGGLKDIVRLATCVDEKFARYAVGCIANTVTSQNARLQLVEERAQGWLLPLTYSSELRIRLNACRAIGVLLTEPTVVSDENTAEARGRLLDLATSNSVRTISQGLWWNEGNIDDFSRILGFSVRDDCVQEPQLECFGAFMVANATCMARSLGVVKEAPGLLEQLQGLLQSLPGRLAATMSLAAYALANLGVDVPLCDLKRVTLHQPTAADDAHRGVGADVSSWSVSQVGDWLRRAGLEALQRPFAANSIDGQTLQLLHDASSPQGGAGSGSIWQQCAIQHLWSKVLNTSSLGTCSKFHAALTKLLDASTLTDASRQDQWDVFISYRRSNGSQLASLLKIHLQNRGLRVFLDVEQLGVGAFDDALLDNLHRSKAVVVVLTEGSLDRTLTEAAGSDWMRTEINTSLTLSKRIVPVLFEFQFPSELPSDIADITRYNGVHWPHLWQDAAIDRILAFLTSHGPQ
eukprot:m.72404 g.72404  ORF g.72404 m.72404 type:complete len:808 (-) comp14247_c0_seq2:66-2489(-)